MTVKELKERLEQFPEDMQVFISSNETDYELATLENVVQSGIVFEHADGTEEEMEVVQLQEY